MIHVTINIWQWSVSALKIKCFDDHWKSKQKSSEMDGDSCSDEVWWTFIESVDKLKQVQAESLTRCTYWFTTHKGLLCKQIVKF